MRNNGFLFPDLFFYKCWKYSIKCEKNITPPPPKPPPHLLQNQNKGIEDIMDIDSNCPYLLFGEITSNSVSEGALFTFQYFLMF